MTLDDVGSDLELTPRELHALWAQNPALVVLDCREPEETAISSVEGAREIPMQQIPDRLAELDPNSDTVVMCHHGVRSMRVVMWLRSQGSFQHVKSLRGGIDAWSCDVDPAVPGY